LRNAKERDYPASLRPMLQEDKGLLAAIPNMFCHIMVSYTEQSPKQQW